MFFSYCIFLEYIERTRHRYTAIKINNRIKKTEGTEQKHTVCIDERWNTKMKRA